jgi:ribonuclease HI
MGILKIYTDGACSGNQEKTNVGGWGAVLEMDSHQKELWGGEANTTNNRMELTAVIEAFKALKHHDLTVQVFTDSSYVANCFREKWYESWESNNWRNAARKSVENQELWKELLSLVRKNNVTFYRVKGHVTLPACEEGKLPESSTLTKHYEKFLQWNGAQFSYEDFIYVTKMNHKVDALANRGIDEIRG